MMNVRAVSEDFQPFSGDFTLVTGRWGGDTLLMLRNRAFTLLEVLIVIGVVAILLAFSAGAFQRFRLTTARAVAISQMRQIGLGLFQYASDNSGSLPGQQKVGQGTVFDPNKHDQLASELGPYLGVPEPTRPTVVKVFVPPAFARAMKNNVTGGATSYVMQMSLQADGRKVEPWGGKDNSVSPPQDKPPMKLSAVPGGAWVFCDADQQNPHVIGQPWAAKTPLRMIHGTQRLALLFNGSVTEIDAKTLGSPPSGGPPPPPPPPPR